MALSHSRLHASASHRAAAPRSVSAAALARGRSRSCRSVTVKALTVKTEDVVLQTVTGPMTCQVFRPTAPGKYPGIVLFSEIFQVTDPIYRSARIMAGHGFNVIVPDIYHEFLPPKSSLSYADPKGADKGNELKITKTIESYDSDSAACVQWLLKDLQSTGKVGVMGFCIGGHLAFRGSMNKGVQAGVCIYPTDIHKGSLGKGMKDGSLSRINEFVQNGTEMMFIWGRQDPHVPAEGRKLIWNCLVEAGVDFTWHEYNGQHAFMRDEGPRYDPELALEVYQKMVALFRRKLGPGSLPVQDAGGSKESKH